MMSLATVIYFVLFRAHIQHIVLVTKLIIKVVFPDVPKNIEQAINRVGDCIASQAAVVCAYCFHCRCTHKNSTQ